MTWDVLTISFPLVTAFLGGGTNFIINLEAPIVGLWLISSYSITMTGVVSWFESLIDQTVSELHSDDHA